MNEELPTLKLESIGFQGGEILRFAELNSTQQFLKENHLNLKPNTCVWALSQGQGQGRRGRSWVQVPGKDLAFSFLFDVHSGVECTFIPQLIAYGFREALDQQIGVELELKWPNDLKYRGSKVAGLLMNEVKIEDQSFRRFVIGIGLNVNSILADREAYSADSIDQGHISLSQITSETYDLEGLLSNLLQYMSGMAYKISKQKLEDLPEILSNFKIRPGSKIDWQVDKEAPREQGVLMGIEESGSLVVQAQGSEFLKVLVSPWYLDY